MKMSAMMFIPRNIQKSQKRYMIASVGLDKVVIPGRRIQLEIETVLLHCVLKKKEGGEFCLPIAELFQVGVLHNLSALKLLNLHLFVLIPIVPVGSGDDSALYSQNTAKDSQRCLCAR
jgi:hypothetical protein